MSTPPANKFLEDPLGLTYVRTALPIIFMMSMNGLLSVVDALFLGHYVGPDALAAVTLMFPAFMVIVALSTLVSSGMSSLLARHLGGKRLDEARAVYAGAHGLVLLVSAVLVVVFLLFGRSFAHLAAAGSATLEDMGLVYLRITVLFSPVMFVLSVNADALRNEGHVGFMAKMGLLVTLANGGFNYVLIALLDMGVAGSAYGTALAQILALAVIIVFRLTGRTVLHPRAVMQHLSTKSWSRILALGAPQSLSFIGFALGSTAILAALQIVNSDSYAQTVSAYGIVTRVLTFSFLPLLGLSHAMQTITGNNYGAGQWQRANKSLTMAALIALVFCAIVQALATLFAAQIGQFFVDDVLVINEVTRILPVLTLMYFLSGPLRMIGAYFQAIGDATRATILGLAKPYLFSIPLTFYMADAYGEIGIWAANPVAEAMLLALTILVLFLSARKNGLRWGVFHKITEEIQ